MLLLSVACAPGCCSDLTPLDWCRCTIPIDLHCLLTAAHCSGRRGFPAVRFPVAQPRASSLASTGLSAPAEKEKEGGQEEKATAAAEGSAGFRSPISSRQRFVQSCLAPYPLKLSRSLHR